MESPSANSAVPSHARPAQVRVEALQERLEHAFADPALLVQALTHSSRAHERSDEGAEEDNERLEFLGDAVVGMLVGEAVYRRYPELSEGALTRMRGSLVSRRHLAEAAKELELGEFLLLGRGEERSGGRTKGALLANAMEAVIGALYLDAGLEATRRLVEARVIGRGMDALRERVTAGEMDDFKSALQEHLQAEGRGQPDYRTKKESGPDHQKEFFVEAWVGGEVLAEGSGSTRKRAEQDAARRGLERLRGEQE